MNIKDGRTKSIILKLASEYIEIESLAKSMITVTNVDIFDRGAKALINVSVYPENKEQEALDFLKRKRSDFKSYIRKHSKLPRIPICDFVIDLGEKNRQNIDVIASKR